MHDSEVKRRECVNASVVRQFVIRDPIARETCKHLMLKPRACPRNCFPVRCEIHQLCAASRYQATRWTFTVGGRGQVGTQDPFETPARRICFYSVHPAEHSLRVCRKRLPEETVLVTKSLVEAGAGQARRLGKVID